MKESVVHLSGIGFNPKCSQLIKAILKKEMEDMSVKAPLEEL